MASPETSILMMMRVNEIVNQFMTPEEFDAEPWRVMIVYGGFTEPTRGRNFIIFRIPNRRVPWSKRIVPALNRLIRPWFSDGTAKQDRYWKVDGEGNVERGSKRLWDAAVAAHYEWDGEKIVFMDLTNLK